MDFPKTFPIMAVGGCHAFDLPWDLIAPHEAQVVANHGQTLARLAERGGLSAVETYAAMNGLSLRESLRRKNDAAYAWEWLRSRAEDAEIAKLRAEVAAERFSRVGVESAYELLAIQSASVVRELQRTERDLAAARAALDGERAKCDEWARAYERSPYTHGPMAVLWDRWFARRAAEAQPKE